MSSRPSVSVVIPTHDAGLMLVKCLESLDPDPQQVEIILVDNGSRDDSVADAIERMPAVRVIRNDANHGFARACNQGASVAIGEYILFLNNDALLTAQNLDVMLRSADADVDGAAWQPVNIHADGEVEFSGDCFTWWGFFLHLQDRPRGPELRTVFATKAACLLVRRHVFKDVGGFEDDYFAYFEEADLCWRVRMAGWEVRVVPDALVEHIGGATAVRVLTPAEIRYLSFRNRIRTIVANGSPASLFRIIPRHIAGCITFVLLFVATGRIKSAAAVLAALAWPLRNARCLRTQRTRAQAIRRVPDSCILRRDLIGVVTPSTAWQHLRNQIFRWERARASIA